MSSRPRAGNVAPGGAVSDLFPVRGPRRVMAAGDDEAHVLARGLHDVDARRLSGRAKRDPVAARRKRRLTLVRSRVRREQRCVLAADALQKEVPVPLGPARVNETLSVRGESREVFGPGLVRELNMSGAPPVGRGRLRSRETPDGDTHRRHHEHTPRSGEPAGRGTSSGRQIFRFSFRARSLCRIRLRAAAGVGRRESRPRSGNEGRGLSPGPYRVSNPNRRGASGSKELAESGSLDRMALTVARLSPPSKGLRPVTIS